MNQKFVAVIMAGGKGQRFWPLSTESFPKQFLDLERYGRTLLQRTFDRLLLLTEETSEIFVATSEAYVSLVKEQLPDLPHDNIIIEPVARDSAPAIALATLKIQKRYGDAITGFFPSDHRIADTAQFFYDVSEAIFLTQETRGIVTLGIKPTYPATGFGYIKAGTTEKNGFKVEQFVEKPPLEKAQEYLQQDNYWWNAGMFLWHTSTLILELQQYMPQLLELDKAIQDGTLTQIFPTMPKISIDYAVMEKTSKTFVVPTSFAWDDLGDWTALERLIDKQGSNPNTVVGNHIGFETRDSIIYSENDNDVFVTVGVENLVIVKRNNTILISHKDKVQDIKKVLLDKRVAELSQV